MRLSSPLQTLHPANNVFIRGIRTCMRCWSILILCGAAWATPESLPILLPSLPPTHSTPVIPLSAMGLQRHGGRPWCNRLEL